MLPDVDPTPEPKPNPKPLGLDPAIHRHTKEIDARVNPGTGSGNAVDRHPVLQATKASQSR